jgi:hypothetical protein
MDKALENWVDKWEKAMEKDEFKSKEKPKPAVEDYYGNWKPSSQPTTKFQNCDTKYWENVYRMSKGEKPKVVTEDSEPLGDKSLGKQREVPDKAELSTKAAELGNTANPVYPDSRGVDQRKKTTPEWADGKKLRELVDMKDNLYKLEVRLNSNPKFGAYGPDSPEIKKIQDQIEGLREKIDQLSNSISPDFVQDELS